MRWSMETVVDGRDIERQAFDRPVTLSRYASPATLSGDSQSTSRSSTEPSGGDISNPAGDDASGATCDAEFRPVLPDDMGWYRYDGNFAEIDSKLDDQCLVIEPLAYEFSRYVMPVSCT